MTDPQGELFALGDTAGYPTLFRVEQPVVVDINRVFPAVGAGRPQDELPLWIRACGLAPFSA